MKNYQNKTVLITGASSGIGEAFAECLAQQGARLILTARRHDRLGALARRLRSDGAEVTVIAEDLKNPQAPKRLFDEIASRGLAVDVLINNAGFGSARRFEQEDSARMEEMIGVNVTALMTLTRLFLPGMLGRGEGGVINLASVAAFQPLAHMAAYAASKAFVLSFSEALWAEYEGTGVRVFALCPGYTATEFHAVAGLNVAGIATTTSRQVAEEGLRALLQGKCYHVVGAANYLLAQSARFSPRSTTARIARSLVAKRVASRGPGVAA